MNQSSTRIADLKHHVGAVVTVRAWVTHLRSKGKVAFVVARDGTGVLQAVLVKSEVPEASWNAFAELTQEASVALTGEVRADARAPGGFEMGVQTLEVIGTSPNDYPIQPKEHGIDFLLDNRTFWLRSQRQVAIMRVRHELEQAVHDFFYARDFIRCDTPILTAAIGERAGLFSTDYFDEGTAYLAQTGQLYGEALAAAMGRIYTFGPTFRALDHRPLHELAGTDPATFQPDAASLAAWIRTQVGSTLPQVDRIDLYETRGCGVVLSWGAEEPVLPV